jgi:capsid protein
MGAIDTAFVKQFGQNVEFLVQQKGTRLRAAVRVETGIVGEEAFFDQLAETAAVKKVARNTDTPLVKSDHRRRRLSLFDYEWADLVDKQDKLKMLIDPENSYALNAAWALGRAIDDEIITAFNGTAYTGKTGSDAQALGAGQQIVVGAVGLTIAKLREAKEILDLADVDPEEPRFIVVSPKQITDLLETTEVTSSDFNTVKALAMGQIDTFLGFKFIISNRLAVDGSADRLVYAWAQTGILLGIAQEMVTRVDERSDKSYANQIYLAMGVGATRMQEEKVVEIACAE